MDDLISRQAVVDALHAQFKDGFDGDKWWNSTHVLAAIEGLPSEEPEETRDAYEQGRIQGHVEMRTELLVQLKKIVGVEVWTNI